MNTVIFHGKRLIPVFVLSATALAGCGGGDMDRAFQFPPTITRVRIATPGGDQGNTISLNPCW